MSLAEDEDVPEHGRWIGFSEDDVKGRRRSANVRRRSRVFRQRVEDNAFHLGYFVR